MPVTGRSWRRQVYDFLEGGGSLSARVFNGMIMLLIIGNVIAVMLESVASIYDAHRLLFDRFETISVGIFTIEYLLRVWCSVENPAYCHAVKGRLRYMLTFMALVDLVAILPFYLAAFTTLDTRFLRVLRMLRIFKLTRHFQSLEILMLVIRHEATVLASAVFIMMVLIVLASGGIYVVEHDVQPDVFSSIPACMWWAVVTLTTVGYGDVVPVTAAGKLFAVLITILGVGMAAMPAGIIASGFTREMQKRREAFQAELREAMDDGVITSEEQAHLDVVRDQLGLAVDDAQSMTRAEFSLLSELAGSRCPHCGQQLFRHPPGKVEKSAKPNK